MTTTNTDALPTLPPNPTPDDYEAFIRACWERMSPAQRDDVVRRFAAKHPRAKAALERVKAGA